MFSHGADESDHRSLSDDVGSLTDTVMYLYTLINIFISRTEPETETLTLTTAITFLFFLINTAWTHMLLLTVKLVLLVLPPIIMMIIMSHISHKHDKNKNVWIFPGRTKINVFCMSPSLKSNTHSSSLTNEHPPNSILLCSTTTFCTTNIIVVFNFAHPGSIIYMFVCETRILFYDIQYLIYWLFVVDHVDGLLLSIYGVDTDDVVDWLFVFDCVDGLLLSIYWVPTDDGVDWLFVFDCVDGLLLSIYWVPTDDVNYDDHLCNNNDTNTNNDTPGCISRVENDYSSTVQYGNNNITFIDIYGVIMVYLAYNYVALVTTFDAISSSSGCSFLRLSSELTPVSFLSSNIFCISSDCGLVCLRYVSVALVASLETTSSLSSPYLSPVPSFLCSSSSSLYSGPSPSYIKSPSFISISVPTFEPSFDPSIAPSTHYFTHHFDNILFFEFNTEYFLFDSYDHIHDHRVVLFFRIQSLTYLSISLNNLRLTYFKRKYDSTRFTR